MSVFLRSFLILTSVAYAVGAAGFCILYYGFHWGLTFGALPRMFLYQYEHPFQYLAVVAVPYGLFGALWVTFLGHVRGLRQWLGLGGVIAGTLLVSCPLGGMLWMLHDMQSGFFPPRPVMITHFEEGALWGLETGPFLVLLSFPLNLFSLVVGLYAPIRLRNWLGK